MPPGYGERGTPLEKLLRIGTILGNVKDVPSLRRRARGRIDRRVLLLEPHWREIKV